MSQRDEEIRNEDDEEPEEKNETGTPDAEGTPLGPVVLSASDTKNALARRILRSLKQQIATLERLLESDEEEVGDVEALLARQASGDGMSFEASTDARVVEGVFDGEMMVGEDGRKYTVPPNYASKSKLVEGDLLRLTITDSGKFLFKQKGPIERQRVVGMLVRDDQTSDWKVVANGRKYRVLAASVSYFKCEPGDECVILIPRDTPTRWAAVENVIKGDLSAFAE